MNTYGLCCIGYITLDKVVAPENIVHVPGGTSLYFLHTIKHFDSIGYTLATALAESEMKTAEGLRARGIDVAMMPSKHTVYFGNTYGESQDSRTQRVLAKVDPFIAGCLENINSKISRLGSLLTDNSSLEVIKYLVEKGLVPIDSQGCLREVRDKDVFVVDWPEKEGVLKYVHSLKVNEHEVEMLVGYTDAMNVGKVAYGWGMKEILLTFGSMGSITYDGSAFHKVPAHTPKEVVGATGAGDAYMTGYPCKRAKGASIEEAGCFAAAMTTSKIEGIGLFNGTKEGVLRCSEIARQRMPE